MEFKGSIGDWEAVEFTDKSAIKIFRKGFVLPICSIEYPHSQDSKYNAQLIAHSKEMYQFINDHFRYLNLDDQDKAVDLLTRATTI